MFCRHIPGKIQHRGVENFLLDGANAGADVNYSQEKREISHVFPRYFVKAS
jgi:hypothetical protein